MRIGAVSNRAYWGPVLVILLRQSLNRYLAILDNINCQAAPFKQRHPIIIVLFQIHVLRRSHFVDVLC